MASTYTCAESRIQNASNAPLRVSPFNKVLGIDDYFSVPGDPYAWLAARHPGIKGLRMIKWFRDAINKGLLRIVYIPTAECGDTWESSSSDFFPA